MILYLVHLQDVMVVVMKISKDVLKIDSLFPYLLSKKYQWDLVVGLDGLAMGEEHHIVSRGK